MSDTQTTFEDDAEERAQAEWVRPHEEIGKVFKGTVTKRFSFQNQFGTTQALAFEDLSDPTKEFIWSLGHKDARSQTAGLLAGDTVEFSCVRKNKKTSEESKVPLYVYSVKTI